MRQEIKQKARQLRERGMTYLEIQKTLGVKIPKSTLSYWFRRIKMPGWYKKKIKKENQKHLKKVRILSLAVNKKKRLKYLSYLVTKNINLLDRLDQETQKIILSILYLGEGAKHTSSQMLSLGNSNPSIIKFFLTLLKNCYNIDQTKFRARIQCRYDQNIKKLEKFWQKQTGINEEQFYPTYIDKRTKGKATKKKEYKGVCTIHYFNTEIQLELEFLAEGIMRKTI
jgi:hypothetical protein